MVSLTSKVIERGTILMDPTTGINYDLVRESRPVKTFGGASLYSYNLRNRATGKMRRTENATPFGNDPLTVRSLEQAFGLTLVPVTSAPAIAKVDRANIAKAVMPTPAIQVTARRLLDDLRTTIGHGVGHTMCVACV